jgi:hypothetical protein
MRLNKGHSTDLRLRQSARSCDHRFWDDCTTIIFGFDLQKAQLFERALRRGGIAEADKKGPPMWTRRPSDRTSPALTPRWPAQWQSRATKRPRQDHRRIGFNVLALAIQFER